MSNETTTLSAAKRDSSIRNGGKKAYRDGRIAGVVYGPETEPFTIDFDPRDIARVLTTEYGRNAVITLEVDGASYQCMVKDTQFNPVRRELTHVDFYVVKDDQTIVIDVPVEPVGRSLGEKLGGLLQTPARTVKVRVAVKDIPATVQHDVTSMQVGDQVYVDEMTAPDGCELVFKNKFPVIRVAARRGAKRVEEEGAEATA